MKTAFRSIVGSLLVLPFLFSGAVEGCGDNSYEFATPEGTDRQVEAAADAKSQFCRVVDDATRLYRSE